MEGFTVNDDVCWASFKVEFARPPPRLIHSPIVSLEGAFVLCKFHSGFRSGFISWLNGMVMTMSLLYPSLNVLASSLQDNSIERNFTHCSITLFIHAGIFYTTAIIGPAFGYVLGSQLLLLYTDFISVDPLTWVDDFSRVCIYNLKSHRLGLTPESKVWVGAWWIGFLIFSFVCLLVAIPLIAYPKSLPGSEKLHKISEAHKGDQQKSQAFTKLSEIPKAFMSLLRNPTFLFLNLAGASEGLIISGFAVFLPKQIENQYSVTAVSAALLMGELALILLLTETQTLIHRFNNSSSRRRWNVPRRLFSEKTQALLLWNNKVLHDCVDVRRSLYDLLLPVLSQSQLRWCNFVLSINWIHWKQGDRRRWELRTIHAVSSSS